MSKTYAALLLPHIYINTSHETMKPYCKPRLLQMGLVMMNSHDSRIAS